MALCLFDCLKAIGLQQHYERFTSMGVCRAAHLSALTMQDYPSLGIRSMEDRIQLLRLVQFIQSLDNSESSRGLKEGNSNRHSTFSSNALPDKTAASRKFRITQISYKRKIFRRQQVKTEYMTKPKLVYESPPISGYNYGLPLSTPVVKKGKRTGEQRIRVCVRKKPLMYEESQKGETDVVTVSNGVCVTVHERKEALDLKQYIQQHEFYFDQVFGEDSINEDVYLKTAYPLVQHTLNGGQSTCFAYGQTGAGKTHTMLGCAPGRLGLYTLAVRDIFAHLATLQTTCPLMVYVSFFEIYCGHLYDLLDHRKRLYSREDGQHVVHIAGLAQVRVHSEHALLQVITHGTELRTQGVSGANPQSSRSHALLQIQLRRPNQELAGRIWFVDLAGSERASDSKEPTRQSRMEGAEINQSLLALKECIRSLDQEQLHTPFRQSKLTQVLKDSFVGDAMTCMIANISPGQSATEHTLNTLRYADRVKELRRRKVGRAQNPSSKRVMANGRSGLMSAATKLSRPSKKPNNWALDKNQKPFSRALCSSPKMINHTVNQGCGREKTTPVGSLPGVSDVKNTRASEEKKENEVYEGGKGRTGGQYTKLCSGEKSNEHQPREKEGSKTEREISRETHPQDVPCVKKKEEEKQHHLRWYHQQLQEFVPSSATSSPRQSSLSSSLRSSVSCSSQQFIPGAFNTYRADCDDTFNVKMQPKDGPGAVWEEMKAFGAEKDRSENGKKHTDNAAEEKDKTRWASSRTCILEDYHSAPSTTKESISNHTVEPLSRQAPAERPLSPVSSSTQVLHPLRLMTNSSCTTLQKGKQEPSPCVGKEKELIPDDDHYISSPLSTSLTQDECEARSESEIRSSGQVLNKKTAGEKHLAQCRNYTSPESPNYTTDPPSSSMRARDQQATTASSHQGEHNHTFIVSDPKRGQMNKKVLDHDVDLCLCLMEGSQSTTKCSSCSLMPSGTRQVMHKSSSKHSKRGMELPQRLSPTGCLSHQSSTSPSNLQTSKDSGLSSLNNNGCDATEPVQNYTPMHPQKTVGFGCPRSAVCVSHHLESNINNQEKKHTQLSTTVQAQCHIVQAHVTQLEEMKSLCHKETVLLSQQENMSFELYVQKLEELMKKKALCVHKMRYKLQPYL